MQISYDGVQIINDPVGSFFGTALGKYHTRSLMLSVDAMIENGAYKSWWPQPFLNAFNIKINNVSPYGPITPEIKVTYRPCSATLNLRRDRDSWGYFHALH